MDNQTNNQEPINSQPTTSESVTETPIQPEMEITPEPEVVNTEPVEVPIQPTRPEMEITPEPEITIPDPISPEPVEGVERTRSTEEQLQNLGIATPPKAGSGFFKVLFVIALIIFIFVISALAFVYFKSQKSTTTDDQSSTTSPTPTTSSGTCLLNDKTYQIGESFASADGCNTCSCAAQDNIVCTEKACLSTTPTTKITTSTSSAIPKITPDKTTLNFYQEYIKNFPPVYKNSPYLTANFIKKLDQTYSEMTGGGVDAILFAQDTPTNFTAKVLTQDTTSATVSLTESNGWSQTLTVKLIVVNGEWKIDSIALNK